MLDASFKEQLKQIFSGLTADYVFDITVRPDHPERADLLALLEDTASCSPHLSCRISDGDSLYFRILRGEVDLGICFKAVPNGHEFSSLLLAVLNADGKGKNLPDDSVKQRITRLKGGVTITTYMSLTCTNCPDVVQALNIVALNHPGISHHILDGALFEEEVAQLNIKAVPAVFIDGKLLHVGRSSLGELLEKLEEFLGVDASLENNKVEHHFDLLVAGGGPAGVSAAIYAARKGLSVAIVAGRIGGQVNETVGIENLISIPYITGKQLAGSLLEHLSQYENIKVFTERSIETLQLEGSQKRLLVKGGESFLASSLIIATGASWRKLQVPGEADYIGRGVAFCPHCDGPFYKGRHVAVIGGGNSGVEAAIDLAGICSKVTVLEFNDTLKADQVLQEKMRTMSNIEVRTAVQTLEVVGDGEKVTSLKLKSRVTGEISPLDLDGVFIQIGLMANSAAFSDVLETNVAGEILTDNNCRTAIKGVYAAGDVSNVAYKQIIIAMGEGAKAALSAFEDIVRGEVE